MNDQDIQQQLNEQQHALAKIYKSVEKMRKQMMWSGIISLLFFIIPLIAIVIFLPRAIKAVTGLTGGFEGITDNLDPRSLSNSLDTLKELGL